MNATRGFFASLLTPSDEQAMWRVQTKDDHNAFAQLVARWELPILRLCARMIGDETRAEDLKQEVFIRIFARRRDYRAEHRFGTWIWRIAVNLCYDELRTRQRRSGVVVLESHEELASIEDADGPAPDDSAMAQEEAEIVRRALLQLPDESRSILLLRFGEGLKLREIAEIFELPETTLRHRLADGLAALTRLLEPTFGRPNTDPASLFHPPRFAQPS